MKKAILLFMNTMGLAILSMNAVAQAPNLGASASFALFTSAGAFTNTGASIITGDIGTHVGALTGFPPGTLIGQDFIADSITTQAANDLELAYADLDGRTCGIVLGTTLGNNQILTQNTYCLGAASTLNANLILDGLGDPNALFIFQIDGALSTNSLSNIVLINGASFTNVYWQINGAVELGIGSSFLGNILANGAINLLEGNTLIGRALTRAGAIHLENNIVNTGATPLLIQIDHLKVSNQSNQNLLHWNTKSECIGDVFDIEVSEHGKLFKQIASISANGVASQYQYSDTNPYPGINYYRLKMKDAFGGYIYSNIVIATVQNNQPDVNFYPNPVLDILKVKMISNHQEHVLILTDMTGKQIKTFIINGETAELNLSSLSRGIYFIKVNDNAEANLKINKL
ncbi:MAG TPA: ice-binding family protein [Chitinophagaceae bacterium]|nr:ice-binding family protein [Chitinophagaceae bacterium]